MTEMFRLLKELTTSRTPKKVLIREEAKIPVTKNINSISLARGDEEGSDKTDETLDNIVKPTVIETEKPVKEAERNNETKNKPVKKAKKKEVEEVLSSRPVEYYLKHRINCGPSTSSLARLELSLVVVESLWNEMKGARIVVMGGGDLWEYTASKGGDGGAFVCLVGNG
ncbi:hypothetical protein Tco_1425662, partial [Tanacetum coccineum]